jgi:hypothetical protein
MNSALPNLRVSVSPLLRVLSLCRMLYATPISHPTSHIPYPKFAIRNYFPMLYALPNPQSEIPLQCIRNDQPHDLIGALVDLGNLGIPHHPLYGKLLDVAVAAENLHRLHRGPHSHITAETL